MLKENIKEAIHLNESLDDSTNLCYTIKKDIALENHDEKDTANQPDRDKRVDRQYHKPVLCSGIRVFGKDGLATKER